MGGGKRRATQYFLSYEFFSSPIFGLVQTDGQTDRQTDSNAYEPTVQNAQVGSKKEGKEIG